MSQMERHKSHLQRILMTWENIFEIILRKKEETQLWVYAQGSARRNTERVTAG